MLFLHIYNMYIYRITHLYSRLLSLNVFWLRIWIFVVYSYHCIHMYIEIVWRSVVYGVYTVFGVGDQWTILEAWHVEGEWGKPGNREQKIKVLQLQRLWTFQCLRQESRERHWSSWREAPIFWFLSYIHTNVYIYTYRDSFVSEKKKSFADTSQLTLDSGQCNVCARIPGSVTGALGARLPWYTLSVPLKGRGKEPAREMTCRQVTSGRVGWERDEKTWWRANKKSKKGTRNWMWWPKSKKKRGTELRVTVRRPLQETTNQREVPSKEDSSGSKWKNGTKVVAKKKCSWVKCWLTVWLWLSLVSPVRSSVVGVAPWSAFKPGFLSLVPSDRGDGDVKLGAGTGAHDLPSSAAVGSPALLLRDACQCLGSLAMTWLLGFWVVVSSGSHKKIVGCFRSLGCFLDWFFPQGPGLWISHLVGQNCETKKG